MSSNQCFNLKSLILDSCANLLHLTTVSSADSLSTLQHDRDCSTRSVHDGSVFLHASPRLSKRFVKIVFLKFLPSWNTLGDFANTAGAFRSAFEQKVVDSLKASQEIFEHSNRFVVRCDPDEHVENSTYLEITKLLQGHIENEMDLNRDRSCVETCQNYQFVSSDFGCSDRSICNRQSKCNGKILSCTSLQDNMWICPSSKESNRRYEYIVYDNGKSLGEEKPCRSRGFHVRSCCGPHRRVLKFYFLLSGRVLLVL